MIHHIQKWKDITDSAVARVWKDMDISLDLGRQLTEEAIVFARQYVCIY